MKKSDKKLRVEQLCIDGNLKHARYCIECALAYATQDQQPTLAELLEEIDKAFNILFPKRPE